MSARAIHAVMVTPSAAGGHPRYTWELMSALRKAAPPSDLQLTLLTSADLHDEFRMAPYDIADVLPPLRPSASFANRLEWATSRVAHYARREDAVLRWVRAFSRAAIVHYQEPPFAAPMHYVRVRRAGCHPVATVHNLRPHRYPIRGARWVTDMTARVGWRQCSTLFVHSAGLQDRLRAELGRRAPPVVAIPHGVWTGHGARSAEPDRDGYLLLFGVMRRNKGIHLMLDALRLLPGKRLVLAGAFEDRSFANEIRSRVAAEKLDVVTCDRVIPESEVAEVFAGASLVMLPYSEFHAQSGVLHMAIAYGAPAVVTDVGALGEQVRRERIGAVAPAADPAIFAQTVLHALEPNVYNDARRRCTELAQNLSWSAAAELTLEAYRRLRSSETLRSA
jgi:glycosyltransferase involved in cell wall biosynthesis